MTTRNGGALSGAFARARLFKLDLPLGSTTYNDGIMLKGKWDEQFLSGSFTTSFAASHRAALYRRVECTGGQLVQKLSAHPVSRCKEGPTIMYGGLTGELCARKTENKSSISALVIDEDNPPSLADVLARADAIGGAFTAFTSHSASLLIHKARVVFYLAEELPVEALGQTWAERTGLFRILRSMLLGSWADTSDLSAGVLVQVHNLPRHRERAPYLTITKPGAGLMVPSLTELRKEAARRGFRVDRGTGTVALQRRKNVAFGDPELARMRQLIGRFLSAHGDRFDIIGALDCAGWDVIDLGDLKATVVCPNSAEHSDPTARDFGCFIANPDPCTGRNFAVFNCRHAHCAGLGTGDLLAMALRQLDLADPLGWLDRNIFDFGTN